jgi:hypothetical protein
MRTGIAHVSVAADRRRRRLPEFFEGPLIDDCGLKRVGNESSGGVGDCGFGDCRLRIETADCGLSDGGQISNRQSQSAIRNLNRQSTIKKSAITNPKSAMLFNALQRMETVA